MEDFVYILSHDWRFANGSVGHFELTFDNVDEAFAKFEYYKFLIETDSYDFMPQFTPYCQGDMSFSVFEDADSPINRQDLVLKQVEVSLCH